MNSFTRLLKQLKKNPDFKYHPKCVKMNVVQLSFTDDLLLFRKGDSNSVKLLYELFTIFSKTSWLEANEEKRVVYFGGVPQEMQHEILHLLGFVLGDLPKRLLFSIQIFWAQIFVLLKKVIHCIEALCRNFLWSVGVDSSKKALIAWETLCWPRVARGLNFLDIATWNKAAVYKVLWNLSKKKDKMQIQWVHMYYGKQGSIWEIQTKQALWMVSKILKAQKYYEEAGWSAQEAMTWANFSIKNIYLKLRGNFQKVEWRKIVCNNVAAPNWTFILYLALNERLQTRERLASLGVVEDTRCALCSTGVDNCEQLFFQCTYAASIWEKVLKWMHIDRHALCWREENMGYTTI
ncbi:uncharacterized protein LOC129875834 [Solanum dulcamara]|uniref:uncharacterized protein LOC129875834 n=1 Tax=Solanum dulcamara TaxID=45834 RepID=UPI0024862DF4|nr:uncharacterized protein LOC129875834 [Solanum dulcamara]